MLSQHHHNFQVQNAIAVYHEFKIIHCSSSLQQAEGLNSPLEQVGTTNVRTEN